MRENYNIHQNFKLNIYRKAKTIAKYLNSNRSQIINILLSYESLETARDEINRSVKTLRAIKREMKYLCNSRVNYISSLFPINLPVIFLNTFWHSTILYGEESLYPSIRIGKAYFRENNFFLKTHYSRLNRISILCTKRFFRVFY